jgi:hypothetical protein
MEGAVKKTGVVTPGNFDLGGVRTGGAPPFAAVSTSLPRKAHHDFPNDHWNMFVRPTCMTWVRTLALRPQSTQRRMLGRLALAMTTVLASLSPSLAQLVQESRVVQPLILSYAAPIAIKGLSPAEESDPRLADMVQPNEGPTVFLVSEPPFAQLLIGADRASFGTPVRLPIKAYGLKIARGTAGVLWISGVKDRMVSIDSVPLSHGYLAKVDHSGQILWERNYGEQTERTIQSVSPLASGDVLVSGKDARTTWLARISSEGNVLWERFVGLGKGSAVAVRDGVIALAALDSCQCAGGYREDVAVWLFDQTGRLINRRIIREGINASPGVSAARIEIEKTVDSIYVFSVWAAYQAKPLEVAKLGSNGELIWSKSFPKTFWQRRGMSGAGLPARGSLSNGDILFAMREQFETPDFVLSRLDAKTGDLSETVVQMPPAPPPSCVETWGIVNFLQEEPAGKVLLFGSPPSDKGVRSCGWIGEADLPEFQ